MVALKQLSAYCDDFLNIADFQDYCPNGLQVEAGDNVTRLVTGVSASLALIEAAVERQADALLVHHGYFWKGENPCLTGMKGRRIRTLMENGLSLLAYHLPLDMHPEVGNNARLAHYLGIVEVAPSAACKDLWVGRLPTPMRAVEFAGFIQNSLLREPLHIGLPDAYISSVGWCTGGAQDYIEIAAEAGVDAFISGEISERTVLQARELGIHYYAAGHHATERYGVQCLGEKLAEVFQLEHQFVDIANPA